MITGPLAYIFAGVVVTTISHGIDLNGHIEEDSEDYRKIRPLYIVQLVVIISLLVMSPINYLVAKATVAEEHDHSKDEDDVDYTAYKPKEWKIDTHKPKVFDYADEFFFKPIFIRSYHSRKKCLGVIKHAFEMSALLYEHSNHETHEHGHDDHIHEHESDFSHHSSDGVSTEMHSLPVDIDQEEAIEKEESFQTKPKTKVQMLANALNNNEHQPQYPQTKQKNRNSEKIGPTQKKKKSSLKEKVLDQERRAQNLDDSDSGESSEY